MNIKHLLKDIKDYQSKRHQIQYEDCDNLNLEELDALVLKFNQMVSLSKKQDISLTDDMIVNSHWVNRLSDRMQVFKGILEGQCRSQGKCNPINGFFKKLFQFSGLSSLSWVGWTHLFSIIFPPLYIGFVLDNDNSKKHKYSIFWWGIPFSLSWILIVHVLLLNIFFLILPNIYLLIFGWFVSNSLILAFSLIFSPVMICFIFYQSKTFEYQLSRDLYKQLPFRLKIEYLFKFGSFHNKSDEKSFFEQHLSADIIKNTKQSLIDSRFCRRVSKLAKPYLMVNHILTREEANKILQKVNQIKYERMENLSDLLNAEVETV